MRTLRRHRRIRRQIGIALGIALSISPVFGVSDIADGNTATDLSGIGGFLVRLSVEHQVLYALLVTGIMAALGIIVAELTELALSLIGRRERGFR
ncbi:MAG: hypothetical protein JW763_02345 [candidate division Zixibacteria bacterium]|nr:hypothetical protein [candidate division Zixibacteria bacterium]